MSIANNVTLGSLRLQARQRSDLESNNVVSDSEFNQYISQSYKRLYDMLVAAYGNDYYVANLFQFTLTNAIYYPLPNGSIASNGTTSFAPALYKLIGVDLQYTGSPTGYVTLKRFEEIERNKYAFPNSAINANGYTNLKYRVSGSNIEFLPQPMGGQVVQLKYVPKPTPLQFIPSCGTTASSSVVTMNDTTDLSPGMQIFGVGIQANTTVGTVSASQIIMNGVNASSTVTNPTATISFWTDATTIDGVSGWEEFIIIDSAIKARSKQEEDVTELRNQRNEIVLEIQGMAEGRDVGQAFHTSDVLGANYGGDDYGGGWDGGIY